MTTRAETYMGGSRSAHATERAYTEIRSLLIAGDVAPGSWLREEDLAERTGVSRTPVREALRLLAQEGFVEFRPRRGVQVVSWSDQDLDELFDLRALLEAHGAAQAAERATPEQIEAMYELCDRMEDLAAGTYENDGAGSLAPDQVEDVYRQIAELNNELHQAVLLASGNAHLPSLMRGLVSMPLVQRTFMRYSDGRLARSMAHHRELVDAIRQGDGGWAAAVMTAHIKSARVELP